MKKHNESVARQKSAFAVLSPISVSTKIPSAEMKLYKSSTVRNDVNAKWQIPTVCSEHFHHHFLRVRKREMRTCNKDIDFSLFFFFLLPLLLQRNLTDEIGGKVVVCSIRWRFHRQNAASKNISTL